MGSAGSVLSAGFCVAFYYLVLILPFNIGINIIFIPISMGGKLGSEKLSDVSEAVQTAQLDLNPILDYRVCSLSYPDVQPVA